MSLGRPKAIHERLHRVEPGESVARIDRRLDSAWHKIERAQLHIDALKRECVRVLETDPEPLLTLTTYFEFNGSYFGKMVESVKPIPSCTGLLIGDAAHNLRCALEHVAFCLGRIGWRAISPKPVDKAGTIAPPSETQFPIADSEHSFKSAAGRHLKEVKPSHRAIIENVQPYKGMNPMLPSGRDPLAALRDLDNADKHRVVNATAITSAAASYDVRATHDCVVLRIEPNQDVIGKPLKAKTELVRIYVEDIGPDPDVQVQAKGTAYIGLDDGGEAVETLLGIKACVKGILETFEKEVFQPPWWEGR